MTEDRTGRAWRAPGEAWAAFLRRRQRQTAGHPAPCAHVELKDLEALAGNAGSTPQARRWRIIARGLRRAGLGGRAMVVVPLPALETLVLFTSREETGK